MLNPPWLWGMDGSENLNPLPIRKIVKIRVSPVSRYAAKNTHHPFSEHQKRRDGHTEKENKLLRKREVNHKERKGNSQAADAEKEKNENGEKQFEGCKGNGGEKPRQP